MAGLRRSEIAKETLAVEGYRELLNALKVMDKKARLGVRRELKSVGTIVANEAKAIAASKGLRDSGELIRRISSRVLARAVVVTAAATKSTGIKWARGYNYPRRYEFEKGEVRAFMRPALDAKTDEVRDRFERVLDDLEKEWGRGQ